VEQLTSLFPDNYTSEVAEAVVVKIVDFTSSQNLTSSQVNDSVTILESLVILQEKVLEEGRTLSLSRGFTDRFIEVSGNLLTTETTDSWLGLGPVWLHRFSFSMSCYHCYCV
jgi:hypothetical protein